jgi:hypothetical protein
MLGGQMMWQRYDAPSWESKSRSLSTVLTKLSRKASFSNITFSFIFRPKNIFHIPVITDTFIIYVFILTVLRGLCQQHADIIRLILMAQPLKERKPSNFRTFLILCCTTWCAIKGGNFSEIFVWRVSLRVISKVRKIKCMWLHEQ